MSLSNQYLLAPIALATLLVACGGGSSVTSTPVTLSGVAATGAAFIGGVITVTDSTGAVVGTSSSIAADGTFSVTISTSAKAPFVIVAARTSADGVVESLISIVPSATSTTINVTPVTSLIAARLSPSGDPTKLAAEVGSGAVTVTPTSVAATVAEVQAILAPILSATNSTGTDPLTGTFTVNGTGYDRLLDSIRITITPATTTSSNIEVGIKQTTADSAAPVAIQFTSQTQLASVPAIPTISSANIVPSGTSALIAQHLAQLTTCYALPTASRVGVPVVSGVATGVATDVIAAACQNAFFANTPSRYLSNGNTIGTSGSFGSLFKDTATGTVFSQGTYEFSRGNGDIVMGYKAKDAAGNETFDTFVVRLDSDFKLKEIGNQYAYSGGVNPYEQLRDFVNQTVSGYYSTGYNISIPLNAAYDKVVVTTPNGNQAVLINGSDGMVFPKLNANRQAVDANNATTSNYALMAPSGTNYIRVRSEYADTVATSGAPHPAARDSGLFFVSTDALDTDIAAFGNQSKWKLDYYNGSTLLASQTYRTRTRAMTIGELRTQKLANLSSTTLASIAALYVSNLNKTTLPPASNFSASWLVPANALPPTQIKLFGKGHVVPATSPQSSTGFNDVSKVGSTALSTTIPCADGAGETHCANPGPGYASFAVMNGFHLLAKDTMGRELVHYYATYLLP